MRILLDMNLTPVWCEVLNRHGHAAIHWSEVGDCGAPDRQIMEWAEANQHVIFTHDLDFGALLAATQSHKPSVIQVRTQDVMPAHLEETILTVLTTYEALLRDGALIVVEEWRSRVRILPLR